MAKKPSVQQTLKAAARGSSRHGTTIVANGSGLRFQTPAAWVRWSEQNQAHPNLHLAPEQLDEVKETTGEWDYEFAEVVNAILPFEGCVAHVGGDGWGPRGVSYADLQVRAYVLAMTLKDIEALALSKGSAVVRELTGMAASPRLGRIDGWRRIVLQYRRFYIDYGATAIVDIRTRRFGRPAVAFAFMYTDHADHAAEIKALLESVEFVQE